MAFSGQTFSIGQILTASQMNQLDTNIDEVRRSHKGSSQPAELVAGLLWIDDTTANLWKLKVYSGTSFIDIGNVDTTAESFRAAVMGQFKNKIINGNFDLWQRGTSFTVTGYTADRWLASFGDGAGTVTRQSFDLGQTLVPGNPEFLFRHDRTTAATVENNPITQRIEDVRTFAGQTITVSFFAKVVSGTKTLKPIIIQFFGTGGSPSSSVQTNSDDISLTIGWQKFTRTIAVPSISGKTIGTNNDDYLSILLQESAAGVSTFTLDVAQFQIEEGSIATEFEDRSIGQELVLAQRFTQVINYEGAGAAIIGTGFATSTTRARIDLPTINTLRSITPTLTVNNPTNFLVRRQGGNVVSVTSTAANIVGSTNNQVDFDVASGLTVGEGVIVAADATNATITLDAEL